MHVELEEQVPSLERQANQHRQQRKLAQHDERDISDEQRALVDKYFKYGGVVYVIKSVAYDQELKMIGVRYRRVKNEKGVIKEKEKRQPLRRMPLDEAEGLVYLFGG